MTDNELFNHFKTHSIRFNETPSDDLWAKIENSLNNNKPTSKPYIFITIGITVIVAFYLLLPSEKAVSNPVTPSVTKQPASPTKSSAVIEEPFIPITKKERVITKINDEVITTPVTSTEGNITDSVKKAQIRTAKVTTVTSSTAEPAFIAFSKTNGSLSKMQPSTTYEIIKKETPGNIVITTKEKITNDEYKQLILDMVNEYENHPETLLTIKAPGHKPFKKAIGNNQKLILEDSTNPTKLNTTTEKLETIPFRPINIKKDSLPKATEKPSN